MTTLSPALTEEQLQGFYENGAVHIPGALEPEFAEHCAREMLDYMDIDEADPESWRDLLSRPGNRGNASPDNPERVYSYREYAAPLWAAMCHILGGEDRIIPGKTFRSNGVYSLANPDVLKTGYAEETWQAPLHAEGRGGWHIDGQESWFRHYLDSPQVGLLVLILFRDSTRLGGATWYAPESPGLVARYYAEHPEGGIPPTSLIMDQCQRFGVAEGKAGDAFILHPFMMHSAAPNVSRFPRLMENDNVSLREPMRFDREDAEEYSPLERSILRHLGVESFSFARK